MMKNKFILILMIFLLIVLPSCSRPRILSSAVLPTEPAIQSTNDSVTPESMDNSQKPTATLTLVPTAKPLNPSVTSTEVSATTSLPPNVPTVLLTMEKSPQQFGYTETFQVGLGDLDNDGDLDAVFANMASNHSTVWLNDGKGQFEDTGQQLTQQGHGLDLGDLDGDGDLDIFLTCAHYIGIGKPSVVYFNDGHGMFEESGQDLGDTGLSGNGVNLLDIDNDGDLDAHVVYYERGPGEPDRVYLNDGQGGFTDSGLALPEQVIAWGDLDTDGDVDIFAKVYDEGYKTLINDGSGSFTEGWTLQDDQAMDGDITLADFDSDGDLDALVANGFRSQGSFPSMLFINDGTGRFIESGQLLNATQGADLAVGDLDGDGDLDVFVANMDQPNEVWLNDGVGHFMDSGLRLEGSTSASLSTVPALGDLNGDGYLDVFLGSFQDMASVWFNGGPGKQPAIVDNANQNGGSIAFVSTRDGDGEIYIMDLDGSNLRQLTSNRSWDGYPSWSPDGAQIAYYTYLTNKHWVIMVMDANGNNARQLTDSPGCNGGPHWSPDGTRIAYASDQDCTAERREIVVIDADGSNPRNLTQNEADDMSASWSPDNQQITFSSNRDGDYEICIMDADGSDVLQLTDNEVDDMMPSWAPDGTQIAFVSDRDGNDEIYLLEVESGAVKRLTNESSNDWFPSWSPDGQSLLFNSWRDGNLEVYIMDTDGSNIRRITDHPKEDFNAVWSP
jgi:Tol biopolymer transport system component